MELALPEMSYQDMLDAQRDLFKNQIEKLQQVVATQCKLTGVNPLSQEMAAGALSIKIGKRPRDLLNPKAVKYMQSVFSIKDTISKRESREISAQFGVTLTQVRDFFSGQRSRVRKFVKSSKEKDNKSFVRDAMHDEMASMSDPNVPPEPVPLDTIVPTSIDEGPSCSKRPELLSVMEDSESHFVENIFSLMRKEESFSGQAKLLQWILRMKNPAVLLWFLTEGGLMILATWLGEAAKEEQTTFLDTLLKLLDYLPLRKALPGHMSAILQSVNKLRLYRISDISHRARSLLTKWSIMFGKNLSKKSNGLKSESDLQDEMLLKQSINEVMADDSWDLKTENSEEALRFLPYRPDNLRKLDITHPLKMLMAPGEDSNKRRGVLPSQTRERRKVQLVEQPVQRLPVRSAQVAKPAPAIQSRPLSADDIQKAKMRAQFMQSKHGKTNTHPDEKLKPEYQNPRATSNASFPVSVAKSFDQVEIVEQRKVEIEEKVKPENQNQRATSNVTFPASDSASFDRAGIEEKRKVENDATEHLDPPATSSLDLEEPPWKKCKRVQIPWRIPPEVKIDEAWSVGTGTESKELDIQKNRIRREREIVYRAIHEIPSNPRAPWDHEMDYDDTLTPVIPIEQLPDDEPLEAPVSPKDGNGIAAEVGSASSESMAEPDFDLLAELLKNPQLVFALTSGQGGSLAGNNTVKLLDMIKTKGVNALDNLPGSTNSVADSNSKVEVSLPSPTPSSEVVPNGPKPDFTRNPFSRQHTVANGTGYQVPAAALPQGQGVVPTSTVLHPQILASQLSAGFQHLAYTVVPPVSSLQTSVQLAENWKTPSPANPQMHHQTRHSNSFNAQYMTTETNLNANTVVANNPNWASSSTVWHESLSNVKSSQVSMLKTPSRSLTPPHPSKPAELPYVQESVAHNSLTSRQDFESNYGYSNNRAANSYTAYTGNMETSGARSRLEGVRDRSGYESWSPDNSPSRHQDYSSARYYQQDVNSRHGYRTNVQQNQTNNPRYQDHNPGSAGHKRWRNYNR